MLENTYWRVLNIATKTQGASFVTLFGGSFSDSFPGQQLLPAASCGSHAGSPESRRHGKKVVFFYFFAKIFGALELFSLVFPKVTYYVSMCFVLPLCMACARPLDLLVSVF